MKPETEFSLLDSKQSLKGYKQKKEKWVGQSKMQSELESFVYCGVYITLSVFILTKLWGWLGGTGLGPSCECEPRPGTTSGWWSVVLVLVLSVSALWYPTDFGQGTWVGQELRAPFVWHDCANTISYRAERESVNSSMEPEAGTETAN